MNKILLVIIIYIVILSSGCGLNYQGDSQNVKVTDSAGTNSMELRPTGIYKNGSALEYLTTSEVLAGTNVTIDDEGDGSITINSTGGGSGSYLPLSGGTLTGTLSATLIYPSSYSLNMTSPIQVTTISSSDYLTLGNGANDFLIYNLKNIVGTALHINVANGVLSYSASARRFKTDITDLAMNWEKYMELRPVSYLEIGRPDFTPKLGLLAEDVYELYSGEVSLDAQSLPLSVDYSRLVALQIKALQELKIKHDSLEADLQVQIGRLEALEAP